MCEQGAALQKYNQELVKCIEQLRLKKTELANEIKLEEEEVARQEIELKKLQSRLDEYSNHVRKKKEILLAFEKSIKESEAAFMKIVESSQVLLAKVLKESAELNKKRTGFQEESS